MPRKVKFPLHMANGADVRTLEELKANFDLTSVLEYYANGKLLTWLRDRYCDAEVSKVEQINPDGNIAKQLCTVFGIETCEEAENVDMGFITRRVEKKKELLLQCATQELINKIDYVALNQDDLIDCLDCNYKTIYLAKGRFEIPLSVHDVTYIGVFDPTVIIKATDNVDLVSSNLTFQDIRYYWDATGVTPSDKTYQAEQLILQEKADEALELLESIKNTGNPRALYLLKFIGELGKQTIPDICINFSDTIPDICINFSDNISDLTELIRIAEKGTAFDSYILAEAYSSRNDEQNANIWYKKAESLGMKSAGNDDASAGKGKTNPVSKSSNSTAKKKSKSEIEKVEAVIEKVEPVEQSPSDDTDANSLYERGNILQKNGEEAKALHWYRKAAEKGHKDAQWKLGEYYYNSGYYEPAVEWYRKAAKQGHQDAQFKLGKCYYYGTGVPKNDFEAVSLIRGIAIYGHEDARKWLSQHKDIANLWKKYYNQWA